MEEQKAIATHTSSFEIVSEAVGPNESHEGSFVMSIVARQGDRVKTAHTGMKADTQEMRETARKDCFGMLHNAFTRRS